MQPTPRTSPLAASLQPVTHSSPCQIYLEIPRIMQNLYLSKIYETAMYFLGGGVSYALVLSA